MARKIKKSAKNRLRISTDSLLQLLSEVYLAGTVDECNLEITEDGTGIIEAQDITNNLIVFAERKLAKSAPELTLGIGNIDLLIKFLKTIEDKAEIKITGNLLNISHQKNRRKMSYLTKNPDLTATALEIDEEEEETPYDLIKSTMTHSAELTGSFIKDCLTGINILKSTEVKVKFENESIAFVCGEGDDHQFAAILESEVETDDDEDFLVSINGEILAKILDIIEPNDEDPPKIYIAPENPVLIECDDTAWALDALADLED